MPRKAITDAPGAPHHIIARGIERRAIFSDNDDRENYLGRLETIVTETHTSCCACNKIRDIYDFMRLSANWLFFKSYY